MTVQRYVPLLAAVPVLWTHEDEERRVRREFPGVVCRTYRRDEQNRWTMYSATAALVLAGELGAEIVDCYGCDMAGELNYDGTPEPTANRTASRWEREREAFEAAAEWLAGRGVEVIRHHGPA